MVRAVMDHFLNVLKGKYHIVSMERLNRLYFRQFTTSVKIAVSDDNLAW